METAVTTADTTALRSACTKAGSSGMTWVARSVDVKAGCWVERWVVWTDVTLVAMMVGMMVAKMVLLTVEREAVMRVGCWVGKMDQPKVFL